MNCAREKERKFQGLVGSDWSDKSEVLLRGFQLILLQPLPFALNIVAGAGLVGVHLAVAADAGGGVVPVEEAEESFERGALGAGARVLRSTLGVNTTDVGHMDGVLVVALHAVGHVLFRPEGYCPKKVCKLQSSYICVMNKKSTKNNEAYKRTKIGINF